MIILQIESKMSTNHDLLGEMDVEIDDKSSHDPLAGILTLPNLRSLRLQEVKMDRSFYAGMEAAASQSMVILVKINMAMSRSLNQNVLFPAMSADYNVQPFYDWGIVSFCDHFVYYDQAVSF